MIRSTAKLLRNPLNQILLVQSELNTRSLGRIRMLSVPDITVTKSTTDEAPIIPELNVTSACAKRIKELAEKKGGIDDHYLRVFVDAGGCSGFQYKFEVEVNDFIEDDDLTFEKDGARVIIDESSLDLLRGSTVDFVEEMIRQSFVITDNPQSESACGCGSSFAIKNFEANPARD